MDKDQNNITTSLGIEKLSKKKAKEVMDKLEDLIQRRVAVEVLDLLGKESEADLIGASDEEITRILSEKNPGLDSLIRAVAISAVREFKAAIK